MGEGDVVEGNIEEGIEKLFLKGLIVEMCLNVGELKWRMEGGVVGLTVWREDAEGRRIFEEDEVGNCNSSKAWDSLCSLKLCIYMAGGWGLA